MSHSLRTTALESVETTVTTKVTLPLQGRTTALENVETTVTWSSDDFTSSRLPDSPKLSARRF
jgi:hypothetical protein